jgi:peptide/nickel transport system substrate-binding protein
MPNRNIVSRREFEKKPFFKRFKTKFLQTRFHLKSFFVNFYRNTKRGKFFSFFRKFWRASKILPTWEKRLVWFLLLIFLTALGFFIKEKYLAKTVEIADVGGVYVEGIVGEPSQINPIFAATDTDRAISRLIFRGLTKVGPDKKILGDIADFRVSPDGLEYTFFIKKNAFWHDGEEVIADDVLFTISLLQDQEYQGPYAGIWDNVSAEKINDKKIVIELVEPYAPFLESATVGILPSHILGGLTVKDIQESEFSINPIGCGPYKLARSMAPKESKIKFLTLERFDKFYDSDIKINKITFNFYENWKDAIKAFERGENMGIGNLTPGKERFFTTKKDLVLHDFRIPQYMGLFFNTRRFNLNNRNVRLAIAKSIDKRNIFKVYGGPGRIIASPILPGTLGYKDIKIGLSNPQESISILKKEGYQKNNNGLFAKNGSALSFNLVIVDSQLDKKIAEAVKGQLIKVGINIKIKALPLPNLQAEYIIPRKYDMILIGENLGLDPDPYPFWHSSQTKGEGLNLSNFTNSEADSLFIEARKTVKDKDRAEKYSLFADIVSREVPAVFLYQPDYVFGTNRALRGVENNWLISDADRFFFVNEWYIKTKRIKK